MENGVCSPELFGKCLDGGHSQAGATPALLDVFYYVGQRVRLIGAIRLGHIAHLLRHSAAGFYALNLFVSIAIRRDGMKPVILCTVCRAQTLR
jgi:hypothetical protein